MWPRSVLIFFIAAAGLGALPGPTAAQPANRIQLPTEANAIAFAPGSNTIFFGEQGIELQLPGPVSDVEHVAVDLDTNGSMSAIRVVQRLTLQGLGDFSFRVPGPATNVEALPESQSRPGVRRGALIWQGFSPGKKLLAARMELFPEEEALRFPLRFRLAIMVGGRPVDLNERASGPLDITLTVTNVSATPVVVRDGKASSVALAPVLDTVRSILRRGDRPKPGQGGIPTSISVSGDVSSRPEAVEAPFRVEGTISFPPGTVRTLSTRGGRIESGSGGDRVTFSSLLGGGKPIQLTVGVSGEATNMPLPNIELTASTAAPSPDLVKGPGGGSWTEAAAGPADLDGRDMLRRLMDVMWMVARIRQFDAYLGNPQPLGPARTSYTIRLAPPAKAVATAPASPGGSPLGAVTASLFALAVLFGLALLWAHS